MLRFHPLSAKLRCEEASIKLGGTGRRTSAYQTLGSPRVGFQSLRLVSGVTFKILETASQAYDYGGLRFGKF